MVPKGDQGPGARDPQLPGQHIGLQYTGRKSLLVAKELVPSGDKIGKELSAEELYRSRVANSGIVGKPSDVLAKAAAHIEEDGGLVANAPDNGWVTGSSSGCKLRCDRRSRRGGAGG